MARETKKKGYEGAKLKGDTKEYREAARKRAEKNAANAEHLTNDMFANSDTAFRELCSKAGVNPTKRQASKFRNKYGKAAHQAGVSNRKVVAS